MGMVRPPNLAGRQLVRAVKRLRKKARLTQTEAGRQLGYDVKKMSRIETGQIPEIHGFKAMLDVYGLTISEWEPYLDLWDRAHEKGWWFAHGFDNKCFAAIEHDACLVRNFEISVVPGLLQSERYARNLFAADRRQYSAERFESMVAVRLKRADRLYSDPALRLHAVVDESILRRRLDPAVMREQLELIVERAALPNVIVQVVRDEGLHLGNYGSVAVLAYPDPEEPDIAFIRDYKRDNDPGAVEQCSLDFEHIAKLALSPEDSVRFIEGLIA